MDELKRKYRVIGVDFDGILSFGKWPSVGLANDTLIDFLIRQKKKGDKLILWTCTEGKELENAVLWCRNEGLIFDAINKNLPDVIEFYGNNSRKITCDCYLDDREISVTDFRKIGNI